MAPRHTEPPDTDARLEVGASLLRRASTPARILALMAMGAPSSPTQPIWRRRLRQCEITEASPGTSIRYRGSTHDLTRFRLSCWPQSFGGSTDGTKRVARLR